VPGALAGDIAHRPVGSCFVHKHFLVPLTNTRQNKWQYSSKCRGWSNVLKWHTANPSLVFICQRL